MTSDQAKTKAASEEIFQDHRYPTMKELMYIWLKPYDTYMGSPEFKKLPAEKQKQVMAEIEKHVAAARKQMEEGMAKLEFTQTEEFKAWPAAKRDAYVKELEETYLKAPKAVMPKA